MKKIDRLLITNFIPPFLVTFGIATFVLLLQILWVYIDDIAGKGLGGFVIIELLAYKCVGLVPMALPLAILISGVMVMGGLAEHYELSSFKSAGISLTRIMRPIMYFGIGAMIVSYLCNDYIIPVANLNFGSRMYDIREKKPTMSMEAGVFNDDFGNYSIFIGSKEPDGQTIGNVLIYDHGAFSSSRLSEVVAESGKMMTSGDGNYFVMQLFNGHQYVESKPTAGKKSSNTPFIRTSFASWNKVFDMTEFGMKVTDQGLFGQNRSMMSIRQLAARIDTIQQEIDRKYSNLGRQVGSHFSVFPIDEIYPKIYIKKPKKTDADADTVIRKGSLQYAEEKERDSLALLVKIKRDSVKQAGKLKRDSIAAEARVVPAVVKKKPPVLPRRGEAFMPKKKTVERPLMRFLEKEQSIDNWLSTLSKTEKRRFITKAKSSARAIKSQAESALNTIDRTRENKVKHVYDMHTKYSMAVVCFIFVFIGAPLGAIVRKGGFGYPLLVSVVAFVIFVVLTIFCRKIAETFLVPADLAAWLPCITLIPIGYWLTRTAMNDGKLFNFSWVGKLFSNFSN